MKKKLFAIFGLAFAVIFGLTACDIQNNNPSTGPEGTQQTDPTQGEEKNPTVDKTVGTVANIKVDSTDTNATVKFDAAKNAESYVLEINGDVYTTNTTSFAVPENVFGIYYGTYLEIKVKGVNTTEEGKYSNTVYLLVGEDISTDELKARMPNEDFYTTYETEIKAFQNENHISNKELLNYFRKDVGLTGSKFAKIAVFELKLTLDSAYMIVKPEYKEGDEKKVLTYINQNNDKVVNTIADLYNVFAIAGSDAIMEAAMSLANAYQNNSFSSDELTAIYNTVKNKLDTVVLTEAQINSIGTTLKDVAKIVIEDSNTYATMLYSVLVSSEEEVTTLTAAQLAAVVAKVNTIIDDFVATLKDLMNVVYEAYKSVVLAMIPGTVNVKAALKEQAEYLTTKASEEQFKAFYLGKLALTTLVNELGKGQLNTKLNALVTSAKKLIGNAPLYLLDSFVPEGLPLSEIVTQVLDAVNPELISAGIGLLGDVASCLDDEVVAAYICVMNFAFEEEQTEEAIATYAKATSVVVSCAYDAVRTVVMAVEDEELELVASVLEDVIAYAFDNIYNSNLEGLDEEMEYCTEWAEYLASDLTYYEGNISSLEEQLQQLKAELDSASDAEKVEIQYQIEFLEYRISDEKYSYESALETYNDFVERIENLEVQKEVLDTVKALLNAYMQSEHDYTEEYANILGSVLQIVKNIDSETFVELYTYAMGVASTGKISYEDFLAISKIFTTCELDAIVATLLENVTAIMENPVLSDLAGEMGGMFEMVEAVVDAIVEFSKLNSATLTQDQKTAISDFLANFGLEVQ